MEVKNQPKLSFNGVDVLNVNFNAISPIDNKLKIDINCVPKVYYPSDETGQFKIIMDLELSVDGCFELSIKAVGNFEINDGVDIETKKSFINTNAPAIMFPYLRSFITTFSASCGNTIPPLVIPAQFFKGELQEYQID